MIRIKFPGELPEGIKAWKAEALQITKLLLQAANIEQKRLLIDKYETHWRNPGLIEWLSDLSHEKCWYTETKFGGDYQEVEHFRPKKNTKNADGSLHDGHPGYYWLAFDLDNYRLCKRRPNAKKGTFFPIIDEHNRATSEARDWRDELPLFLDPLDEEDYLLLSFDDTGKPVPAEDITAQDVERVKFTIEKYYLDERVLNLRRAETWKTCRDLYNKYLNGMKLAKANNIDKVRVRESAKNDLMQLKKMLMPNEEFSAVAKQSLKKTGESMAFNIACSSS